jgi:OOP family OmpA-OmpF porin
MLQGHTDSVGMKKYNQKLSEKRAIQVRNVMINRFGASPDRILALGFGEDRPTEENTSRDGRARNRRVVIVGLKTKISVGF